jgi:soluble lytic murein transglycosylase-like protein
MPRVDTIRLSASSLAVSSLAVLSLGLIGAPLAGTAQAQESGAYSSLVASHAAAHGLPPSLVHRVIMRESRYNSRAVSKGNYGIMQIRLGTARAMGYTGSAAGLLDPNVNMTYAVKYLAGAYRAAGGNADRAVALYASGYGGRAARVSPEARAAYASAYGYERSSRRGRAAVNPAPVGALAQEVR